MRNVDLTKYETNQARIHEEFINDPHRKCILDKMQEIVDSRSKFILTENLTAPSETRLQKQINEDEEYFNLFKSLKEYEMRRWPGLFD